MDNVSTREELINLITNHQSPITNQQSTINNQQSILNQPFKKHLAKMNELVNQHLTKICDENTTAISKSIQTRSVRLIKL